MTDSYTAKELAETLGISRRRVYQLAQVGILQRSTEGLYDKSALSSYIEYLRRSIAKYSGATRGNPSAKRQQAPLTPERKKAIERGQAAMNAEIDKMMRSMTLRINPKRK